MGEETVEVSAGNKVKISLGGVGLDARIRCLNCSSIQGLVCTDCDYPSDYEGHVLNMDFDSNVFKQSSPDIGHFVLKYLAQKNVNGATQWGYMEQTVQIQAPLTASINMSIAVSWGAQKKGLEVGTGLAELTIYASNASGDLTKTIQIDCKNCGNLGSNGGITLNAEKTENPGEAGKMAKYVLNIDSERLARQVAGSWENLPEGGMKVGLDLSANFVGSAGAPFTQTFDLVLLRPGPDNPLRAGEVTPDQLIPVVGEGTADTSVDGATASSIDGCPKGSVCLENPISSNSLLDIFGKVIQVGLGIMGSVAFMVFVYGGVMWIISGGSAEKITKGTQAMLWAAIGICIIFASYAIIALILQSIGAK